MSKETASSPRSVWITIRNRPRSALPIVLWLLVSAASCRKKATKPGDGTAVDQFHQPDELPGTQVLATLERTGCYGECPVYRLTVNDDGRVVYVGTRYVTVLGRQQYQLSVEQLSDLRGAFQRAGFMQLRDYDRVENTDDDWALLSFRQGLTRKRVRHYHADNSAPAALSGLEDEFDRIVGSGRFVGVAAGDSSRAATRSTLPENPAAPPSTRGAGTHGSDIGNPADDTTADPDNHP